MPRAIWSGSISFGLVNVPVKMYTAVRQQDLHFNQFQENTNSRIHYKRVSEKTGKEVPYEKIVKGYEISKGNYVMVTPEELESFNPKATRTIEIEDFVDLADVDPVYFEHTYYLAPDDGEGSQRAYALLRSAMEKKGRAGVGRMVMRTKQYLAAIRPFDRVLALSTMLFHDEVVDWHEIDALPVRSRANPKEVKMAEQIIDSLTTDWKPERYGDTYREQVLEFIKKKAAGEEIVVEEEAPEEADVSDLMAALEASLEASKGRAGKRGGQRRKSA